MAGADGGRARRIGRRPPNGSGLLVLIGGACSPTGDALGAFVAETRGGPIVGLTTASADPVGSARAWIRDFEEAGAPDVHFPIVARREDAERADIARRIAGAAGVFLGGGDQIKLVATISGTPVEEAIRAVWQRGGAICGTSAGAAALTETTLAHGEVDEQGNEVEMYIGPGLGLLGYRALIDTHFAQRRRLHRLFVAIADYPELLGLGIDEDTAFVVRGHVGTVAGRGGVTFVDGRTVRYDNAGQVSRGGQITLSHLRVGLIGTGHEFDLRERELVAVLRAEEGGAARVPVAALDARPAR